MEEKKKSYLKLRLEIGLLSGQFQRFLHIFRKGALLAVQLPLQGIPLSGEFTVLLLELLAQLLLLLERLLGLSRFLLERLQSRFRVTLVARLLLPRALHRRVTHIYPLISFPIHRFPPRST